MLVFSDQCLGLSHRNMENVLILKGNDKNWSERERKKIVNVLILKGNDKNWSERERNKIVEAAVASYLQNRRKRKFAP